MQEPIWFPVNRTLMTRLVRSERERDLSHSKSTSRTCSGVCPSMNKFLWLECWLPIASTDSAATVLLTKSHVCCFRNISKKFILELNCTEKCKKTCFTLNFRILTKTNRVKSFDAFVEHTNIIEIWCSIANSGWNTIPKRNNDLSNILHERWITVWLLESLNRVLLIADKTRSVAYHELLPLFEWDAGNVTFNYT